MTAPRENDLRDRPTGELLRQLSDETTALVKQEVELAKAELQEKGKQAGIGAGMFGGAGLFGSGRSPLSPHASSPCSSRPCRSGWRR